ncbi:hypothetical protein ACH4OH_27150 [Streptomyces albidoflavus]
MDANDCFSKRYILPTSTDIHAANPREQSLKTPCHAAWDPTEATPVDDDSAVTCDECLRFLEGACPSTEPHEPHHNPHATGVWSHCGGIPTIYKGHDGRYHAA